MNISTGLQNKIIFIIYTINKSLGIKIVIKNVVAFNNHIFLFQELIKNIYRI